MKKKIAELLSEIAFYLELKGENSFKVRAFSNASRNILRIDDFESLVKDKKISSIKGVGKSIAEVIYEFYETGKSSLLEELKQEFPEGFEELFKIKGLGAKKLKVLYEKLKIASIGELEYACNENRLAILKGFGKKTQENILKSIKSIKHNQKFIHYNTAYEEGIRIIRELKKTKLIKKMSLTGKVRRKCEVVEYIDILIQGDDTALIKKSLDNLGKCIHETESFLIYEIDKFNIRFFLIDSEKDFIYFLFLTTGSENFIQKSSIPQKNYSSEIAIFNELNLPFVFPELREDLDFNIHSKVNLIKYCDLKGIFHIHTTYSDGANNLEEIVKFLVSKGYDYAGISDHSKSAYYANGLSEDEIKKQHEEIDRLNEKYHPFRIFKGIESDILKDGSLDYSDDILESFDFVIVSVHSAFNMKKEDMTNRIIKAISNPYTTILGHPTGRLLLYREAYEVDMDKIIDALAKYDTFVEINSHPYRLDISWQNARLAKNKGIKFFISPDAHNLEGFDHTKFGINVARKAGLSKEDVVNTLSINEIMKLI